MHFKTGSTIESYDYHTAGEPFRIVDAGPMEGLTVLDRRSWAQNNLDDLRRFLVNEPRGHADMYGGFVVPPDDTQGDLGVVFFHSEGFSTACGHGTIALVTWAIENGFIKNSSDSIKVIVDVPSGRLQTEAKMSDGKVDSVTFRNVSSFVSEEGMKVNTKFGPINIDISFGGAFYASVSTDQLNFSPTKQHLNEMIAINKEIRLFAESLGCAKHPNDERLSGIYGSIFYETMEMQPLKQRNVTVFADGQVDRSPCGSGTSARLALLLIQKKISIGEPFLNYGLAGGFFTGKIEEKKLNGIITSVEGSAYKSGQSYLYLDPRDPIGLGFNLR